MPEVLACFKALADETRLRLLNVLFRHELNVNELMLVMDMGQSRISRHLKILSSCGLLVWRREGLWVFYSVPPEGESRALLNAVLPFFEKEPAFRADLDMAAGMLEERARKTRQFFNAVAEDWDKLAREILGDFDLPGTILRRMPPCDTAVDLGCGTGNVLKAMQGKARHVIGVDGSPRMLELARRRFSPENERVSLRIGDLSHLPLRDGEADFASLNMVLHHVQTPAAVPGEIHRVLAPGGLLALTDFNRHDKESMRREYGDLWLGFTAEDLTLHLTRAGFVVRSKELFPVERDLSLHVFLAEKPAA